MNTHTFMFIPSALLTRRFTSLDKIARPASGSADFMERTTYLAPDPDTCSEIFRPDCVFITLRLRALACSTSPLAVIGLKCISAYQLQSSSSAKRTICALEFQRQGVVRGFRSEGPKAGQPSLHDLLLGSPRRGQVLWLELCVYGCNVGYVALTLINEYFELSTAGVRHFSAAPTSLPHCSE